MKREDYINRISDLLGNWPYTNESGVKENAMKGISKMSLLSLDALHTLLTYNKTNTDESAND